MKKYHHFNVRTAHVPFATTLYPYLHIFFQNEFILTTRDQTSSHFTPIKVISEHEMISRKDYTAFLVASNLFSGLSDQLGILSIIISLPPLIISSESTYDLFNDYKPPLKAACTSMS